MAEDSIGVLQEIADLLRRRVEQTDEAAAIAAERQKKFDERMPDYNVSSLEKMNQESEKRLVEMRLKNNQLQDEEREFRQQLIAELQRHNILLEQILSQNTP